MYKVLFVSDQTIFYFCFSVGEFVLRLARTKVDYFFSYHKTESKTKTKVDTKTKALALTSLCCCGCYFKFYNFLCFIVKKWRMVGSGAFCQK